MLVLFYREEEFEPITVSSKATAEDVVNDMDIQVQLDKAGINNWLDLLPYYVTVNTYI